MVLVRGSRGGKFKPIEIWRVKGRGVEKLVSVVVCGSSWLAVVGVNGSGFENWLYGFIVTVGSWMGDRVIINFQGFY